MISATDPVAVLLGDLCDVCKPGDEMANHIVVQDDRNAAKHLTDDVMFSSLLSFLDNKAPRNRDDSLFEDLDVLGHRILDEAALFVAPISDSPKPPPCRDIVAGIIAGIIAGIVAGIVAAGVIEAALDGCNFPARRVISSSRTTAGRQ